jgi:uncharacterized protein (UPF0332 family)
VLDPTELLRLAQNLCLHPSRTPRIFSSVALTEAELRRAVSTAYYALFHTVLKTAADRLVGDTQQATGAYSLVYRGFDHLHMKKGCEELRKPNLSGSVQKALKRSTVSSDTREFATAFIDLQVNRHFADYDPTEPFTQIDVQSQVDATENAMQKFASIAVDEQLDILAFLLVKTRS